MALAKGITKVYCVQKMVGRGGILRWILDAREPKEFLGWVRRKVVGVFERFE